MYRATSNKLARRSRDRKTVKSMIDLKLQRPVTEPVEVDAETLAAIDRAIQVADQGRTVSLDQARQKIPQWISKFESLNRR